MRVFIFVLFVACFSSCAFQGPSLSFKPFDTASEADIANTEEAVRRAFQAVDARLKALEAPKNEAK